ncbi:hypothetical protein [Nocardioides cynanchi]|uniref:hypothetical protein n=1 Tax=Nocardioides cynanchi TaxID=2558918 RepID=UPI0012478D5F|nr:hypothetical protein [Nocardioides cynanchi]
MSETYTVVLLVEQALTAQDAAQVHSLHEALEADVHYHVLLPVEDAAARVEAAMGSINGDGLVAPASPVSLEELETAREYTEHQSAAELASTLAALTAAGATADGEVVDDDPITALAASVARLDAGEAIILTRSHVVAEFFHVDWTSRARRRIGVPLLHLLEHESFDEQAGAGEGVTGL